MQILKKIKLGGIKDIGNGRYTVKRYEDKCYAVVRGNRRGPVGHDILTAIRRFQSSGLIANAKTDKR